MAFSEPLINAAPSRLYIDGKPTVLVLLLLPVVYLSLGVGDLGKALPFLFIAAYSALRLMTLLFANRPQPMAVFFWVFFLVFFGMAPLAQAMNEAWPLETATPDGDIFTAGMLLITAGAGWELGRIFFFSRARAREIAPRSYRSLAPSRLRWLLLFAACGSAYEMYRLGGPQILFANREALNAAMQGGVPNNTAAAGIHGALLSAPLLVGAVFLIGLAKEQSHRSRWKWAAVLAAVAAIVVRNPVSSSRYAAVSTLCALMLAVAFPLSVRALRSVTLLGLSVLIFFFQLPNMFRSATSTNPSINFELRAQLAQGDYDATQQVINTLRHVEAYDFTNGHQILSAAFFWVPRDMWEGKGLDSGVLVARGIGFDFTNLSCPLPAEAYLDGGFLGCLGLFIVLGIAWTKLDSMFSSGFGATSIGHVAVILLAVYQMILLRGSLLQATGGIVVQLVLLFACTSRQQSSGSHRQVTCGDRSRAGTMNSLV